MIASALASMMSVYDGDGLKRVEINPNSSRTTLIWDGQDYLQGRG